MYCASCSEESEEVTKFCSKCGAEAKWLADKPEKKEEDKDTDKKKKRGPKVKKSEE